MRVICTSLFVIALLTLSGELLADSPEQTERIAKAFQACPLITKMTRKAEFEDDNGKKYRFPASFVVPLFTESGGSQVYLAFHEDVSGKESVTLKELGLKKLNDFDEINRAISRWCKTTRKKNGYYLGFWNGLPEKKGKITFWALRKPAFLRITHYSDIDLDAKPGNDWLTSLKVMQTAKNLYDPEAYYVLPGSERLPEKGVMYHRAWLIDSDYALLVN